MPLVLAIKDQSTVVVATDTSGPADGATHFGQLMSLSNRSVLLIAGNLEAVRHAVMDMVLPKVSFDLSPAGLAQLVQAALIVDVAPKLPQLKGRVELIVAGIDPIRHVEEPAFYYMDSAQDFHLTFAKNDAVAAGSTAAVTSLVAGHSYAQSDASYLQVLAKECLASTKMRWPAALGNHIRLGVISSQGSQFQDY